MRASIADDPSASRMRHPAISVAVCFALGIGLDRIVPGLTFWIWNIAAMLALGLAIAIRCRVGSLVDLAQESKIVAACLCLAVICLGGLRHHWFWSVSSVDEISRFAAQGSRLVCLKGQVAEPPIFKVKTKKPFQSVLPPKDTTVLTLDCFAIKDGTRFVPVHGRVHVRVSGNLAGWKVAEEMQVTGWMSQPLSPANLGEFDFGDYLKRQKIRCVVHVSEPEAILRLPQKEAANAKRLVDEMRTRAEHILQSHLNEQNAKIAAALFLGVRTQLPEDVRDQFAQSGMMHILALSGLHVGILAALVWLLSRVFHLSPRVESMWIFCMVLGLVVISGARPSIVRAAVYLGIFCLGRLANRQSQPENVLALAAIAILAWNPSNLFDVGTQLSFLAVMGLSMSVSWKKPSLFITPLAADESQLESGFEKATRWMRVLLWRYACLLLGIWLLTGPLIAARFHIISPIGMLLNFGLILVVTAAIWLGFLLLGVGALLPMMAGLIAFPLDGLLTMLLSAVKWGADLPGGHFQVAGPPDWWLAGYYGLFAGLYGLRFRLQRPEFTKAVLVLCWLIVGLGMTVWPRSPAGLRLTFLSVGHGSAILVEFPNGKNLLYDAGALDDGQRAFRAVQNALWSRGIKRLDAIVISHPDLDHINAIPQIAEDIPVGKVFVSRSLLKSSQEIVPYVVEQLAKRKIPIVPIGREDRLNFDDSVSVEVQHPDPTVIYRESNATSVVLRLMFAERSVLLMGDVEKDGLADLMEHDRGQVDVLQSPHHGSRTANTPAFAAWANPKFVVVSGGFVAGRTQELQTLFGSAVRLCTTYEEGAVIVEISPTGALQIETTLEH